MAIDFETANADLASICSVGLVGFTAGEVTQRLTFLVNPEDHFDPMNVAIHGITPERVADAPTLRGVLPALAGALSGKIAVHHTAFDRVALSRATAKHQLNDPRCTWLDSSRVARCAWERFAKRGYGLENLAAEFGIDFRHHDAGEDARVAGLIVLRAMAESGLSLDDWLARVARPISPKFRPVNGNPDGRLAGEVIVFTGTLSTPRREAAAIAAQAGCEVADRVTADTTILVVGDEDMRQLRGHATSAKHRRAEELIAQGVPLTIIGEIDFNLLMAIA